VASIRRRPVLVYPWLELESPITIGDIVIGSLVEVAAGAGFSPGEVQDAEAVSKWFCEVHGVSENGAKQLRHVKPMFAARKAAAPRDARSYQATVSRMRLASLGLGTAVLVYSPDSPSEVVQPYLVNVFEAASSSLFPLPGGGYAIGKPDAMTIVRPTWIGHPAKELDRDLLHVLARLAATASRDSHSRANRTLSALQWFMQAYSFSINMNVSDRQNLVALTTAFELLLVLPRQDKKTEFAERIVRLTSEDFRQVAEDLYTERSEVVHAGGSEHPVVGGGHMSLLQFGRDLFHMCLERSLVRVHHRRRPLGPIPVPAHDGRIVWLKRRLTPNRERVQRLASLSADRAAKLPEKQTEFLELLLGLHANRRDTRFEERLLRKAVANACKVLKHALYHTARDIADPAIAQAMRELGEEIFSVGTRPDVTGEDIGALLLNLADLDEYGIPKHQNVARQKAGHVPVLDRYSAFQLLEYDELVGGLAMQLYSV
jgi:hypothetical protein